MAHIWGVMVQPWHMDRLPWDPNWVFREKQLVFSLRYINDQTHITVTILTAKHLLYVQFVQFYFVLAQI